MFIFTGKLTWSVYALNESITFVVPGELAAGQPIWSFWQWTVNASGVEKANYVQFGKIDSVGAPASDGSRPIAFSLPYYSFDGSVGTNNATLDVVLRDPQNSHNSSQPMSLPLFYSDASKDQTALAYVGKLNWYSYAQNEMATLVLPHGFGVGAPVCLLFEWTEDAGGNKKAAWSGNAVLREYTVESNGTIKATFRGMSGKGDLSYYSWDVEVEEGQKAVVLGMTNQPGSRDSRGPYKLDLASAVCSQMNLQYNVLMLNHQDTK